MNLLYGLPILFFSIVVHEIAHGWVALKLGDPTAHNAGRITLNPLPHIDPIGSILVPVFSYIAAGSVFIAWAKPVPVNPMYFKNYRRDDILVSVAGPVSNFVMAFLCTICFVISFHFFGKYANPELDIYNALAFFTIKMFEAGITLNIFLAVFNLIPVPPLDGSHVIASLLPENVGERYRQLGFFGIFIVIMLMRIDVFRDFIIAIVNFIRLPLYLIAGALI